MSSIVNVRAEENDGTISIISASSQLVFDAKAKSRGAFERAVGKRAFTNPAIQTIRITYPNTSITMQRKFF